MLPVLLPGEVCPGLGCGSSPQRPPSARPAQPVGRWFPVGCHGDAAVLFPPAGTLQPWRDQSPVYCLRDPPTRLAAPRGARETREDIAQPESWWAIRSAAESGFLTLGLSPLPSLDQGWERKNSRQIPFKFTLVTTSWELVRLTPLSLYLHHLNFSLPHSSLRPQKTAS